MFSRIFGGVAVLVIALGVSTPTIAQTITVTDVLDRKVEVPAKANRILLGFYFEDFFAVGGPNAYDRVVAITRERWEGWRNLQWRAYVDAVPRIETLIDIGDTESGTFSLEATIAAKPDLAILSAGEYNALGEIVQRMEAAGIPVVAIDYNAQEVEKHVTSTLVLGAVLGQPERAKRLADQYAAAYADVRTRLEKAKDRPRVYIELARKGAGEVDNSYGNTMWGKLIEAAGGTNIAKGQIAEWGPLNPEYVLAQKPKVIFLAGSGWLGREQAVVMGPGVVAALTHERMLPYLSRPGWNGLPAVKSGSVYALYHGGARTLYDFTFLQYIAKVLHPDLFEDVDPQANLDAFFAEFMPIRFNGTYMTKVP